MQATAADDASAVVFSSAKANILETVPASFGQTAVYLWDRTSQSLTASPSAVRARCAGAR